MKRKRFLFANMLLICTMTVQAVRAVEFLAVVLISLACVSRAFAEKAAKRIIVIYLGGRACWAHLHAVAPKVILQVIKVEGRTSHGHVPPIYQYLFQHAVLVNHIPAIVCRDCRR